MTPQEKAKELTGKMWVYSLPNSDGSFINAKRCALIAVDEILKVSSFYNDSQAELIYWKKVKEEIGLI